MPDTPDLRDRRPLATRNRAWARALAATLARRGVAPNAVSVLSIIGAAAGAAALAFVPTATGAAARALLLLGAAAAIQFRLLCNMLDGMIAVEGNRRSATGDLFNEVHHTSNLDGPTVWAVLPAALRAATRPVAARDYWDAGPLRRHLAVRVLHAVLINRKQVTRDDNRKASVTRERDGATRRAPRSERHA